MFFTNGSKTFKILILIIPQVTSVPFGQETSICRNVTVVGTNSLCLRPVYRERVGVGFSGFFTSRIWMKVQQNRATNSKLTRQAPMNPRLLHVNMPGLYDNSDAQTAVQRESAGAVDSGKKPFLPRSNTRKNTASPSPVTW